MHHWYVLAVALGAVACSDTQGPGATSSGTGGGSGSAGQGGGGTTGGGSSVGGTSGGAGSGAGAGSSKGGASGAGGSSTQTGGAGGASGSAASAGSSGSSSGGAAGSGGSGGDPTCAVGVSSGSPPEVLSLTGAVQNSHDPVIIQSESQFYSFSTGDNVLVKTSPDLLDWDFGGEVFDGSPARPSWLSGEVPGVANLWAPDISFFGGKYHLYYSASTFGSNRSCIGHATRDSLDSGSFVDEGPVICSNVDTDDNWNAIDPNVVIDQEGTPWLSFGSFWSGIKLIKLDQNGERDGTDLHSLASRPSNGGALEAPFIVWRCGYYYLFTSWDKCCDGVNSTYKIRVGRATSVTGPYTDREGTALTQGGGTPVLEGDTRWRGPGHSAVLFVGTDAYNIYHSYDADNNGTPTLRIAEMVFDEEGWPVSAGP